MHHFCQSVRTFTRKMMNGLIAFSPSEIQTCFAVGTKKKTQKKHNS